MKSGAKDFLLLKAIKRELKKLFFNTVSWTDMSSWASRRDSHRHLPFKMGLVCRVHTEISSGLLACPEISNEFKSLRQKKSWDSCLLRSVNSKTSLTHPKGSSVNTYFFKALQCRSMRNYILYHK